jgi:nucleoside-diphosphate-sugar epimerase
MTKVLVTGATGMLGGHLVDRLLRETKEVRVLLRPESWPGRLESLPVESVRCSPDDPEGLKQAVDGCRIVYHLAAYMPSDSAFRSGEVFRPYQSGNVDFTENLLSASRQAGVERFVFVSSTSVYDPEVPSPIGESSRLQPPSAYGKSKAAAEARVVEHGRLGLPFTILRPCITYGPRDRHFLPHAIRLADLPLLPLIDGGRHTLDLAFVGDVVELIWRSSLATVSAGKTYNATSGSPQPLRSLFEEFHALGGGMPAIWPLPGHAFQTLAPVLHLFLRYWVPGLSALVGPVGMRYMNQDIVYDMTAAYREVGGIPKTGFREGLVQSLDKRGSIFRVRQ